MVKVTTHLEIIEFGKFAFRPHLKTSNNLQSYYLIKNDKPKYP